ncbi:uncharacterized protein LOC115634406 isoform X1 [Scaptodrosophila lebanonensis]|uniref:Uncharacterized protein LOC115634406 isoform X1 n=1 Tax=Drosophila lebanonensis TaxID=7225 RepID=A0A6J2UHP2_DROLE|nr:uncharacterized protein LOC115634406 isoform X1 [Scaptodrosophila lebanonensis]
MPLIDNEQRQRFPLQLREWQAMDTMDDIANDMLAERTHLAHVPELLRHLENINDSDNEMGQPENRKVQ